MPIISLGIIISAIGVGILIPDFISWIQDGMPSITESMKAEKKHIELTREFLGLLLILGVLIFHFVQGRKVNKA